MQYDELVAGILYCSFFLFHMQLLSSRPIAQNVNVWFKNMLESYFNIVLSSLITDSNWMMTWQQLQKWPGQTSISLLL